MKITIETKVAASLDKTWQTWTSPDDIMQWNAATADWRCPAAEIDLRPGGRFSYRMEAGDGSVGFNYVGIFTKVFPNRLLEFMLEDGRSVRVEFVPGDQTVTVRETFEIEETHQAEMQRQGWQAILDHFARHVEAKP